ncbi:MAG: hypothetical protein Q9P14_10585 [candidate division KSB1 bacterium]|nr:hypothetical protein [candidate division KSB1 bacterium]
MSASKLWIPILILTVLCLNTQALAQEAVWRRAEVKYISPEAVYINAGKAEGIRLNDSLRVYRDGRMIGLLLVRHVATHSAACEIVRQGPNIRAGDQVRFQGLPMKARDQQKRTGRKSPKMHRGMNANRTGPKGARVERGRSRKSTSRHNQVSGYLSLDVNVSYDLTGKGLAYWYPGVSGKLEIKNVFGSGLTLRYRQRSRHYRRSNNFVSGLMLNEWTHRFYELALTMNGNDHGHEFAIGRILVPSVRGIGYLDGGYYSMKLLPDVSVGVVAGLQPEIHHIQLQTRSPKYGFFVNYERRHSQGMSWQTAVAFSGSMQKGVIDRDFVYVQNQLWASGLFSIYQSVEIDINRGWRRTAEGRKLSLSNLHMYANVQPIRMLNVFVSYDARRQTHNYNTRTTPDSLFDGDTRQGVFGGVNVTLPWNLFVSVDGGIRFHPNYARNHIFGSFLVRARHIPFRGDMLTLRVSAFQTQLNMGLRPSITYGFTALKKLPLHVTLGSYLYKTGDVISTYLYTQLRAFVYLSRLYFVNVSLHRYWNDRLKSMQMYLELGRNF